MSVNNLEDGSDLPHSWWTFLGSTLGSHHDHDHVHDQDENVSIDTVDTDDTIRMFRRSLQANNTGDGDDEPRGRTILTVLYLTFLGLCFVLPVFLYCRLNCDNRRRQELHELEQAGLEHAVAESARLAGLDVGEDGSRGGDGGIRNRAETRAMRRKYREERRARILQLFAPVRMVRSNFTQFMMHIFHSNGVFDRLSNFCPPLPFFISYSHRQILKEENFAVGGGYNASVFLSEKPQKHIADNVETGNQQNEDVTTSLQDESRRREKVGTREIVPGSTTSEVDLPNSLSFPTADTTLSEDTIDHESNNDDDKSNRDVDEDADAYILVPKPGLPGDFLRAIFSMNQSAQYLGSSTSCSSSSSSSQSQSNGNSPTTDKDTDKPHRRHDHDHHHPRPRRHAPIECSICLCDYTVGSDVVWSSNPQCDHVFHASCIEVWLMKQREGPLCPCCRRDFVIDPYDNLDVEGDAALDVNVVGVLTLEDETTVTTAVPMAVGGETRDSRGGDQGDMDLEMGAMAVAVETERSYATVEGGPGSIL